jgi:hypothetical protein
MVESIYVVQYQGMRDETLAAGVVVLRQLIIPTTADALRLVQEELPVT